MTIQELYEIYKSATSVQTDTRKLQAGDLFFALKGDNFNGNKFAQKALDLGAAYAIIDEEEYDVHDQMIYVPDALKALQDLATYHRNQFDASIPFIGITGSNGKTTTKELIHAVLLKKYKTTATKGNFNNHIGVPLTILETPQDVEIAIIEMGANHQKEIESYCRWAQPNFGLINNCGKAHLEGFGGIEGVRKGKGELYDYIRATAGAIFINADLDYLREMAKGINQQFSYGEYEGTIRAKLKAEEPFLEVAVLTAGQECVIKTNLVGLYNLPNVLAAVTIGLHFSIPIDLIKEAIEQYAPTNNRSQHLVKNGVNIILDAYNANPTSMLAAIHSFAEKVASNKVIMLGAMKELGEYSKQEHESIAQELKKYNWKAAVLVGAEFEEMAMKYEMHYFATSQEARAWYNKKVNSDDWVYIKGSRLAAMEKIIE